MRILHAILNLLAGLVLTRFTVSKFAAWPESVAGFEDMASSIGLDPTLFRITSGFIIGIAALTFFINFVIFLFVKNKEKKTISLLIINSLYGIGAMFGALLSEFLLRSQPAWMLVVIALAVIALIIANLLSNKQKVIEVFPSFNCDCK